MSQHNSHPYALLLIFCFFLSSYIQPTDDVYAIPNNDSIEIIKETISDDQGNVYFSGETTLEDAYIAKYSETGQLAWSEVFGGNGTEILEGISLDKEGNVLLLGKTTSIDLPVKFPFQSKYKGEYDLFLSKWDSDGDLQWRTYLGGSGDEFIRPFMVDFHFDSQNNIIICGLTESYDFPTISPIQDTYSGHSGDDRFRGDLFITKISPDGILLWSTYFGGHGRELVELNLDEDGNIILYGRTESSEGFPILNAIQDSFAGGQFDAFLSKIDPQGNLLWSTYLGGSNDENIGQFHIDTSNDIIITGTSSSDDYPYITTNDQFQGSFDMTVAKFSKDGNLIWGRIYGGSLYEPVFNALDLFMDEGKAQNHGIQSVLDSSQNITILCRTSSTDISLKNQFDNQSIKDDRLYKLLVAKFGNDGNLIFLSYAGMSFTHNELLSIDSKDAILITGDSYNDDLKTKNALLASDQGMDDVFVTRILPNGSLDYSTYLGGQDFDGFYSSVVDRSDNLAVLGLTKSLDFPVTNTSSKLTGANDLFISRFNSFGELIWSEFINYEGSESSNIFGLVSLPNGGLIIILVATSPELSQNTHDTIINKYDENGNLTWRSVLSSSKISSNSDKSKLLDEFIIISVISLIGFCIFGLNKYYHIKKLKAIFMNSEIRSIISPIFNDYPNMIFVFNGVYKPEDRDLIDELKSKIPREIYDFKYMLNPIRLSIIKLLYEHPYLTTIQIKEALNLSWAKVNHNLQSLKLHGAIRIEQRFQDGGLQIIVSAQPAILTKYNSLREAMLEFFNANPDLDQFLDIAENYDEYSKNQTYPTD